MSDNLQFFIDDENESVQDTTLRPWKVLVVDDEEQVHQVTRLTLNKFTYQARGLQILNAYSASEAKKILEEHNDISVALIDVVMETDTAGLDLVKFIREKLKNVRLRIVLRTGQPGQAPESDVIKNYDINDYKSKTELTLQKLYTLLFSTLRSYELIRSLEDNQQGLEYIIAASNQLMLSHSFEHFIHNSLQQLSIFFSEKYLVSNPLNAIVFQQSDKQIIPLIGSGIFSTGNLNKVELNGDVPKIVSVACSECVNQFNADEIVLFCQNLRLNMIVYIQINTRHYQLDRHLLNLFSRHLTMVLENILLTQDVLANQKEMIYRLSSIAETRSLESGNHIKRVSLYSKVLATAFGLDEQESEVISLSAALHDIGKVGITDDILHKPGKLDPSQWETMQKHAQMGFDMLADSQQPLLELGAEIARNHHERWDGNGYPKGLQGEQIPLAARICTVADVFDALGSKRAYKEAWQHQEVIEHMQQQKGKMFDPAIIDLLISNMPAILLIRQQFAD